MWPVSQVQRQQLFDCRILRHPHSYEVQKGLEAALIQSALYSKRLCLPMPTNALYHTSAVQPLFSVAFISMVQVLEAKNWGHLGSKNS